MVILGALLCAFICTIILFIIIGCLNGGIYRSGIDYSSSKRVEWERNKHRR